MKSLYLLPKLCRSWKRASAVNRQCYKRYRSYDTSRSLLHPTLLKLRKMFLLQHRFSQMKTAWKLWIGDREKRLYQVLRVLMALLKAGFAVVCKWHPSEFLDRVAFAFVFFDSHESELHRPSKNIVVIKMQLQPILKLAYCSWILSNMSLNA